MLWRRLAHRRRCFGTQAGEELSRHHLRRALNHSLAHTRNRAANLNVARVTHLRSAFHLLEIQITRTLKKSRRPFAVDDDTKVFRLAQILEPRRPVEYPFDRSDTGSNRCCKRVLGSFFQTFTTGNAALQHLRIYEALIDAFARRVELVSAFQFHCTLAFAARIARRVYTCAR